MITTIRDTDSDNNN